MKHFIRKIIALLLSGSIVTLSVPMIHSKAAQEMWLDGEENGFKYSDSSGFSLLFCQILIQPIEQRKGNFLLILGRLQQGSFFRIG